MDNVENVITAKTRESEVDAVEDNWILLNWSNKQRGNEEIAESVESREDLENKIGEMQVESDDIEVSCIDVNSDDSVSSIQPLEMEKDLNIENWIIRSKDRGITVLSRDVISDDISDRSAEIQEDMDNGAMSTKDKAIKACAIVEPDDTSDDISVITESDNAVNINSCKIYQLDTAYEILKMLGERANKQIHISEIFTACLLGIAIGFLLGQRYSMTIPPETYTNEIDAESFKTEIHNIINACKDLKEVNAILNEIKTNIPVGKETYIMHIWQLLRNINHTNNKSDTIMEPFNSNLYLLKQLEVSMHVLSSLLGEIHGNNSLRNETDKALGVVNDTKAFYETLILFNNSTQDVDNFITVQFLRSASNQIHYTSQSLISDLVEKINKITLHVYNKYNKVRRKLGKELCRLKNILPNGSEFLKQSIEHRQFLKDYDKSCFSNNTSKKFKDKTSTKRNATVETSFAEGEYQTKVKRPKQEDSFKSNDSIKKIFNDSNANIEGEKLFLHEKDKMENHILRPPDNHCESKLSLCNNYMTKQGNQQIKSADWQFQRSRAREQLRQPVKSNGYFSRDQSSKAKSKNRNWDEWDRIEKMLNILENIINQVKNGPIDADTGKMIQPISKKIRRIGKYISTRYTDQYIRVKSPYCFMEKNLHEIMRSLG